MENKISAMKKLFAFLIFVAVVTAVYYNGVHNDFVFDDKPLIVRNDTIKDFSNLTAIINHDNSSGLSYRPVRFLSLMIDYAISGESPVGYHISNMIYHALSGYMLFLVLFFMFANVPWLKVGDCSSGNCLLNEYTVSLFATLVFLTHPAQVDSVTYISGRRDILSTLFFLLAFYSYLKYRYLNKKWQLGLVVLFYAIAISAKEMAVTLPIVILMFEVVENMNLKNKGALKSFWDSSKSVLHRYKFIILLLIIFAVEFIWYSVVYREGSHRQEWYGGSAALNFLTAAKMWMTYLRLIFFPIALSADYSSYPIAVSPFEFESLLAVGGVVILFYAIFTLLKKNKGAGFGLFWYVITLLPVSQIIPHHELMAEHYLYLPIIGFMIALGSLLLQLKNSEKGAAKQAMAILSLVIILYSARVVARNSDWRDEKTLWMKTTEVDPKSYRAWFNLGNISREEFSFDKAIIYYNRAIEVTDDKKLKSDSLNSIGAMFVKDKRYDDALRSFMESLSLTPDHLATINNLAGLYIETGDFNNAERYIKMAFDRLPDFFEAKINYATLLYKKGEKESAKKMFAELLDKNPGNLVILNLLAKIAIEEGREDDAKRYYEEITLFNRDNADAHYNLGNMYFKKNFLDLAINEFWSAVKINAGLYEAHLNLGNIYAQKGDSENAVLAYQNAATVRPKVAEPHLGLALIYLTQLKDFENAKKEFEKCLELDPNQPSAKEIKDKIDQLTAEVIRSRIKQGSGK